jgi:hypothetical protein
MIVSEGGRGVSSDPTRKNGNERVPRTIFGGVYPLYL